MIKDVLLDRNFLFLIAAQILSKISDRILLIGISWFIIKSFNSHALAVFFAIIMLPYILAVFFSGRLINHFTAISMIKHSEFMRALIYIIFAFFCFFSTKIDFNWLMVASFLASIATAVFNPAVLVAPKEIFKEQRILQSCLGSLDTCSSVASILGPVITVPLYSFFGMRGVILSCGLLYLAAWVSELRINCKPQKLHSVDDSTILSWLKQPYQILKNYKLISFLLIIFFLTNLFVIPLQVFLPLLVHIIYHGSVKLFSLFEVCLAVGALLGGSLMAVSVFFKKPWQQISIPYFLFSISYIALAQASTVSWVLLGLFFMGFFLAIGNVTTLTFFQIHSEQSHHGDIMAYVSFISTASAPLAMSLVSFLLKYVGAQKLIMLYAILTVVVTSLILLSSNYRKLEQIC
jgi:MFS family permease